MPKEDYLLKYLEKLSRVIAAMLGFRDRGFPEDAIRLADETYREMLTFDIEKISEMKADEFVEKVRNLSFTSTYIEALAKIIMETAVCFNDAGDSVKMKTFSEKALLLYLLLNEKDKTFSFEREMVISELEDKLKS